MKAGIPLPGGLSLAIADRLDGGATHAGRANARFPTARLQKGLLLLCEGRDLAEEGVGFGVPILKRGARTIFPGGLELAVLGRGPVWEVTAAYRMSLVERLAKPGGARVKPAALYAAKDSLAALHRRVPALRGPLTATSAALRRRLGWVTTYEDVGFLATVHVAYTVRAEEGVVAVAVDASAVPPAGGVTELVLMNELGAHHFDRYEDSDGAALQNAAIGTWDEVTAARASFVGSAARVSFSLEQVPGARLHRGRELIGARLAWAGFGYSCPPALTRFTYDVSIARTPTSATP